MTTSGMWPNTLLKERDGKTLKVEIFESSDGSSCKFYINEELVAEEMYPLKSRQWAEDAAENWLDGIKTLKG